MTKKLLIALLCLCGVFCVVACDNRIPQHSQSSVPEESQTSEDKNSSQSGTSDDSNSGTQHTHEYVSEITSPTCTEQGYTTHTCACEDFYVDTYVDPLAHALTKTELKVATCTTDGNVEYYTCSRCKKYFADENGETELQAEQLGVPAGHTLIYHAEIAPVGKQNGNCAYWECSVCDGFFEDESCQKEIKKEDTVIVAPLNIPDFLVEVESGRDVVVLQISDPQITVASNMETKCNQYIRETVMATKPDLILVTGDLTYGTFDSATGSVFTAYVNFMESLQVPWAPVFGNHDNECPMGVDWQCEQLENADYCLFKQRDLTGNGNYSVGIEQDGELLRVFYMLDSNGCANPSEASKDKVKKTAGFGQDQIDWYTQQIRAIHAVDSDVKISFAYHIQQAIFGKAFEKYGNTAPLNLDTYEGTANTDFGYIGAAMKTPWDTDYTVFNGMKQLGVDSIFVGHEHCNSASIVYEGVRLQYSQKVSTYDRYNWVFDDGTIGGGKEQPADAWELMGGTVIPISQKDGAIGKGYIYYCLENSVTITFVQDGEEDVYRIVRQGETLTDIPTPAKKTGYTVVWDTQDFTDITEDMTVCAVTTANIYTVTYSADGFDVDGLSVQLTYGGDCSVLYTNLQKAGYVFLGWEYGEEIYTNASVWNVAEDVTLTAYWAEDNQITVTFVNTDGSLIRKVLEKGQTLTDIPKPKDKTYYVVDFENWYIDEACQTVADFENLQANITVYAKAVGKEYVIIYKSGDEVLASTTVRYGEEYELIIPDQNKYRFEYWTYNGKKMESKGVWLLDIKSGDLVLIAVWGESAWTESY